MPSARTAAIICESSTASFSSTRPSGHAAFLEARFDRISFSVALGSSGGAA
jgi:hypothetical protein